MLQKFAQISREAIYGPISYDPELKNSLDDYVKQTKSNVTEDAKIKEKEWTAKLEEQQKGPWLK